MLLLFCVFDKRKNAIKLICGGEGGIIVAFNFVFQFPQDLRNVLTVRIRFLRQFTNFISDDGKTFPLSPAWAGGFDSSVHRKQVRLFGDILNNRVRF